MLICPSREGLVAREWSTAAGCCCRTDSLDMRATLRMAMVEGLRQKEAPMSSASCRLWRTFGRSCDSTVEISDHPLVDDVGEVALQDPHRFLLRVTSGARVVVDQPRARGAAQLGDSHEVQGGVDAPVAAAVEPVTDRLAVTLARRRRHQPGALRR